MAEIPAGLTAYKADGMVWTKPEGDGWVLWPILRGAFVDAELEPIRQPLPALSKMVGKATVTPY